MSAFRMNTGIGYRFRPRCPIDQATPPQSMGCRIGGCPDGYYECGTSTDSSGVFICCLGQDTAHPPDLAEHYESVAKVKVRPIRLRSGMVDYPPGRRMVQARVRGRIGSVLKGGPAGLLENGGATGMGPRVVVATPATGSRSCYGKVTHKGLWVCCQGTCRLAVRTSR